MDAALENTRASEESKQQMQCMTAAASVNAVGKRKEKTRDQSGKTCFSCGKKGYFARAPCCPVKGRKCAKCAKYGHFASCCKGNRSPLESDKDSQQKRARNGKKKKKELEERQTKWEVTRDVSCEQRNPAFSFAVMEEALEEVCMVSILSESTMNVSIDGFVQEVLIDSGSVISLMGEVDFFKLEGFGSKGEVEHCSKKLFAYGRKQIDAIGQFGAVVCTGNVRVSTDFVLVKRGRCILGSVTARELDHCSSYRT